MVYISLSGTIVNVWETYRLNVRRRNMWKVKYQKGKHVEGNMTEGETYGRLNVRRRNIWKVIRQKAKHMEGNMSEGQVVEGETSEGHTTDIRYFKPVR